MSENTRTLGQAVTFVNTRGQQRAALVTGTPESVQPGHSLAVPEEGQLHLAVFRTTTGQVAAKLSVPHVSQVETIQAEARLAVEADAAVEGEEVGEFEDAPVAHWF